MSSPSVITESSFQGAWVRAVEVLAQRAWDCNNLVVHIQDVTKFDQAFHEEMKQFSRDVGILLPKDVAYTIFPHNLYRLNNSRKKLFDAYNGDRGLYSWTRRRSRKGWGTYFRRMTHYEMPDGSVVNQLDRVILAMEDWEKVHRAAYAIVIPRPGTDTARPRGGPCLTFILPQIHLSANHASVGLLCVFRNHEFLERAYGNYWGLCNLTQFIASETQLNVGPLVCVSSHAYVASHRSKLRALLNLST
ncbi:MAG: hypothetical protein V3R87_02785 [Dehalococcoidia bacterium]